MEKLRAWLKRRGFGLEVVGGCPDEVDLRTKTVHIDGRHAYQLKLSSLIHECGHVEIFLRRARRPRERICGRTLAEHILEVGRGRTVARASRLALLQEEMDAWEAGERLGKRLAVRYHRSVLEKDRVKSLMTYVAFTASQMRMAQAERRVRADFANALHSLVKFNVDRARRRRGQTQKRVHGVRKWR